MGEDPGNARQIPQANGGMCLQLDSWQHPLSRQQMPFVHVHMLHHAICDVPFMSSVRWVGLLDMCISQKQHDCFHMDCGQFSALCGDLLDKFPPSSLPKHDASLTTA